jgi:protein-disulfide isomerase
MKLGSLVEKVAIAGLALSAMGTTALFARRELSTRRERSDVKELTQSQWVEVVRNGAVLHQGDQRRTLVVFSDYQCPACKSFNRTIDSLIVALSSGINIIHRHFPLEQIHPLARDASRAVICAARQGRFRELHDAIFATQDSLAKADFAALGDLAKVPDRTTFERCLGDSLPDTLIDRDVMIGEEIGLRATPTVIYNGRMFTGAISLDQLMKLVRSQSAPE